MKRMIRGVEFEEGLESIEAMATINPQYCNKNNIQIEVEQRDEGPIPHVHVYHDHTRDKRKCSYIRLDKAEYSDHHRGAPLKMPRDVKEKFIEAMEATWKGHPIVDANGNLKIGTGYEAAVSIWVDTYEDGSFDKFPKDAEGNLVMPDYATL